MFLKFSNESLYCLWFARLNDEVGQVVCGLLLQTADCLLLTAYC